MAEIGARWIADGTIDQAVTVQRALMRERQALVAEILGDAVVRHHPTSLSAWSASPNIGKRNGLPLNCAKTGLRSQFPTRS